MNTVTHPEQPRGPPPNITATLRSNAVGVSRVIHTARGRVLHAARLQKWHFSPRRVRAMLSHLQADLQNTQHEVEAEVGEFIQSPHLLFQPLRMLFTIIFPMSIPLFFMPTKVLLLYALFVFIWYTFFLLYFATEVSMRPPWYKKGLPLKHQPPYWKGFIHNPHIDCGLPYEDVQFPTVAGLQLRAWFIPSPDLSANPSTRRMLVFVHGVGRDRRTFLRHVPHFIAAGFSCLLFDLSEHGLSDSFSPHIVRGTLFGAREQYDVIAAAEYLRHVRGASQVAFIGTSCGATSAILAAALRPELTDCVVAENPFTRADDLLRHHLHILSQNYLSQNSHQIVRRAVFWLAGKMLMLRMGYYLQSYGAIDAASQLKSPLLVAHSTEDDIVPFDHGMKIYNAALRNQLKGKLPPAAFLKFNDAAHCALFDSDPNLWISTVLPFVQSAFENAAQLKDPAFSSSALDEKRKVSLQDLPEGNL